MKGNYLSITELAKRIGTTVTTIKRWYTWYEDDGYEKPSDFVLPSYVYLDNMNTKYFNIADVDKFVDVKNSFSHGGKYRGIMNVYTLKTKTKKG